MSFQSKWFVSASACALVLLLGACADAGAGVSETIATQVHASPTDAPPTQPIDLVVLHTNDLWGETDPCG